MAAMPNLFDRLGKPQPTTKDVVKAEKIQPIEEIPATRGLLEKLTKERPPLTEAAIKLLNKERSPIERLQIWLDRKWRRSTITWRELRIYGPHSDRDRQTTLNHALILVEQGFLVPIEGRQHNTLKWRIIRKHQRPADHPQSQPTTAT
jgi:hypothetical protein